MKAFFILIGVLFLNSIYSQPNDLNEKIDQGTLQRIFDQIHLPEIANATNEYRGLIPGCEILIEVNNFVSEHDKFIIDEGVACVVDKAIIFQLNQNYMRIESIKKTDNKIIVEVILINNNHKLIKRWQVSEKNK